MQFEFGTDFSICTYGKKEHERGMLIHSIFLQSERVPTRPHAASERGLKKFMHDGGEESAAPGGARGRSTQWG